MTRKLDDFFNLPPMEENVNFEPLPLEEKSREESLQLLTEQKEALDLAQKIEQALPRVKDIDSVDVDFDAYASKAMETYERLVDLGMNVDDRNAGMIFDVASKMGMEPADEDFNQTLAVWGVGDGPYLMVPARGPTTIRGTAGGIVDNLYLPLGLLNTPLTLTRAAIMALDAREQLMQVENMLNDSLDPYSFVKEGYFQRQQFKIYDGNPPPPEETLDDDTLDFLDEIE